MKKVLYTIYDTVSQTCWVPFCAFNDRDAQRSASNLVNQPSDTDVFFHPADYMLQSIAIFNDSDHPTIVPIDPPQTICRLDTLRDDRQTPEV